MSEINTEVLKDKGDEGAKGQKFEMLRCHVFEKNVCPIYFYFGKYGIYIIDLVRGKMIETTGFRNQILSNNSSNEFGIWIKRIIVHRISATGFKQEVVHSWIIKFNRQKVNITCWDFKNPRKFVGRKKIATCLTDVLMV